MTINLFQFQEIIVLVSPFLQAKKALRKSRGIALLCFQATALEGGKESASAPVAFYPRKRPGIHFTGGWVGGSQAGLDRCGKSRPHRDSIPEPFSP
jgi:hypothetical protein